jgi:hypothetical protein
MARFNEKTTGTKTVNLAGGEAYSQTPELDLVSILLTSFANDQFYEKAETKFDRITELLKKVNPLFAAKAAIYARTEFGMRSISHVLASEIAKHISKEKWAKEFYKAIVYRPDDMSEILAYHKKNGKISNAMKKGFAMAFNKFDAYQLAKYRCENKSIKLIDIVNLVHPKGNDKNKEALKLLVKGELKSTDTWQSKLTNAGQKAKNTEQKAEFKKQVWIDFVNNPKLEYFALLRNLRNILEQAPEAIEKACIELTNENRIKKSMVLPFRYFTAIKELEQFTDRNIIIALSKAAEIALNNVPELPGKTLIAVDVSGSMHGRPEEIARMFGAVLYKSMDSILLTFDNNSRFITLNPTDSLLTLTKSIKFTGGGTNFSSIFDSLTQKFDRIIILSDMQAWMQGFYYSSNPKESFKRYKERTGTNSFIYSFDLAGHGTMQFPEQNVFCLAGFSEKIFDIMKLLESDRKALINKINEVMF